MARFFMVLIGLILLLLSIVFGALFIITIIGIAFLEGPIALGVVGVCFIGEGLGFDMGLDEKV